MNLVKELKSAYNICCGDKDLFSIKERNLIHFVAVRSIIFKLTKTDTLDAEQMNDHVLKLVGQP